MAAKKAALVKAVDGGDLAKAGIDVKLSKMEIADYIADKAKKELESRIEFLNKEIETWTRGYHDIKPTKEQQKACDMLTQLTGNTFICKLTHTSEIDSAGVSQDKWLVCIGHNVSTNWRGTYIEVAVTMPANPDQFPDVNVCEFIRDRQEAQTRMQELGKKKHRTILLEKILAGSESGKKVLADLQSMVSRAVNG